MRSSLTTNGYLLSANRIARLNKAGLRQIQISVDNLTPDRHSAKSLCVLERQLKLLSIHADFSVNLNTVLGVSEETAEDVLTIADRARDYGFELSVSLMHNGSGSLAPLGQRQRQVYAEIGHRNRSISHFIYRRAFQQRLIDGLPLDWQCRAGARYMYICEHGLVHRCSQQRDHSCKALADYGWSDIQREYQTRKDCSRDCTINCVQLASAMDRWSGPQIFSDPQRAASKDPRSQT
jgi:MoaA/NifB/PqqE/SkfB family radical SAM enzyme